jgi:hypothetical protein
MKQGAPGPTGGHRSSPPMRRDPALGAYLPTQGQLTAKSERIGRSDPRKAEARHVPKGTGPGRYHGVDTTTERSVRQYTGIRPMTAAQDLGPQPGGGSPPLELRQTGGRIATQEDTCSRPS